MSLLVSILLAAQLAADAPAEPPAPPTETPAQTLKNLQAVYASSCGERGILYHAYDDLCDGLQKQIRIYERQVEKAAVAPPPPPKN